MVLRPEESSPGGRCASRVKSGNTWLAFWKRLVTAGKRRPDGLACGLSGSESEVATRWRGFTAMRRVWKWALPLGLALVAPGSPALGQLGTTFDRLSTVRHEVTVSRSRGGPAGDMPGPSSVRGNSSADPLRPYASRSSGMASHKQLGLEPRPAFAPCRWAPLGAGTEHAAHVLSGHARCSGPKREPARAPARHAVAGWGLGSRHVQSGHRYVQSRCRHDGSGPLAGSDQQVSVL